MDEGSVQDRELLLPAPNRWPFILMLLFLSVAIVSLAYLAVEHRRATKLAASNAQVQAALNQTRAQLDDFSSKLTALTAQPKSVAVTASARSASSRMPRVVTRTRVSRSRGVDDHGWKDVQSKLAEQQNQITATQQDLKKTRTDLEANLNSARNELSGSIARTHDELVALERKGERNYYEFDLLKSKDLRRVGPLSLSLRKTNTKHRYYDLVMVVEDSQLSKKHVNLYEPVLVYPADSHQAVELVVNRIGKNDVHGYVSEPKYKQAELVSQASASQQKGESSNSVAKGLTESEPSPRSQSPAPLARRSGTL